MLETVQPTCPPTASRPRSWAVVAAAMFVCGWGGNQFTPLLLMYRRLGGYSALSVDAFLGAYVVGLVPGLLLAGPISDRRGCRTVLVAGTAASAVASLVLAFGTDGPWPIYGGRLLTGVAVGIAMAVGTSWVKELSSSTDSGLAARRASLCQTAGFGLGAGVAGALAQWGPWPRQQSSCRPLPGHGARTPNPPQFSRPNARPEGPLDDSGRNAPSTIGSSPAWIRSASSVAPCPDLRAEAAVRRQEILYSALCQLRHRLPLLPRRQTLLVVGLRDTERYRTEEAS
ncbi:MFS transporter [Streptomyces sp. NPDC005917]|uniref:MFS transporter n=1 Tax=unclassified Streptomyces TaxID=2593676 RepID=UPI0033F0BEFB